MISEEQKRELCRMALEARRMSYAPYSHFKVGAALLTEQGDIYQGCNIENSSFSPTVCAERTAVFKAVSEGKRDFTAIAIAGAPEDAQPPFSPCPPCGVCRQVLSEFCRQGEFEIILAETAENYSSYKLNELLPLGFGAHNL